MLIYSQNYAANHNTAPFAYDIAAGVKMDVTDEVDVRGSIRDDMRDILPHILANAKTVNWTILGIWFLSKHLDLKK